MDLINKVKKLGKSVLDKASYLGLIDWIVDSKSIAIVGHDKIDWDSLGSVLAMQQWIKNKFPNKKIKAYTNRKYPAVFEFLQPEINYWENLKLEEDTDLIIVLDAANLERLGDFYKNNEDKFKNTTLVNIDHHISNTQFWNLNIVDWQSPATAQLLFEILKILDLHPMAQMNTLKKWIDGKVATYLLMWILTDTQSFMIPLANAKTLWIAKELIELGADKQYLIDNIFLSKDVGELKLQWLVFNRIKKLEKDGKKIYWSYLTNEDIESVGLNPEDSGVGRNLSSLLNQIKDADFVCLWKIKDEETSVSFRSKEYDVNEVAKKLWWGGHKNAAGAIIKEKLSVEDIERKLKEIV